MKLNYSVTLPGNVRVNDVAKVIGKLLGMPTVWVKNKAASADVPGVSVTYHRHNMPLATITCDTACCRPFVAYYHFEHREGKRLLALCDYHPHAVDVGIGLIGFFGGELRGSCPGSSEQAPYWSVPANQDDVNMPEDGPAWDAFQRRIDAVKPSICQAVHAIPAP